MQVSKEESVNSFDGQDSSDDEEIEFPSEKHASSLIGQFIEIGDSVYEIDGWLGEGANSAVVRYAG